MPKISIFLKSSENIAVAVFSFLLASIAFLLASSQNNLLSLGNLSTYLDFFYFLSFIFFILVIASTILFINKLDWNKIIIKLFWAYLATEIIFLYEFATYSKLHYAIYILADIYLFAFGFFLIKKRDFQWKKQDKSRVPFFTKIKKYFQAQGKFAVFIVLIIVLFNFSFSLYRIDKFAGVDEPLWLFERIPNYWNGWQTQKLEETFVSDKPGVTVSILSGIGLLKTDPNFYESINWEGRIYKPNQSIENLYNSFRFPIALFASLSLFLFYFFLEKIFTKNQALVSFIFLGFSPILIGMNRIINPDSLLWIFTTLSILSYLTYLRKRKRGFLYSSGVFLGLSLLTKYVSNILFVFFLGIIFLEYIFRREKYENISIKKYIHESLIDYSILAFISLAIFTVLCPAVWVKPGILILATLQSQAFHPIWRIFTAIIGLIMIDTYILRSYILSPILNFAEKKKRVVAATILFLFVFSIFLVLTNTYSGMKAVDFEDIMASPKSGSAYSVLSVASIKIFLANFYPLIFGISPVALLAIISGMIIIFIKNQFQKNYWNFLLIIFIFLYYLGSVFTGVVSTIRYQIILYPVILIIAGLFLGQLLEIVNPKKKIIYYDAYALLLVTCLFSLVKISPFYSGYASILLPQKYFLDIKDMGTGSYEAAQFLNSLPNSQDLNIWTDKTGVCYYFNGSCYTGFAVPKTINMDYAVVTSGRESRTAKMARPRKNNTLDFSDYYDQKDSVAFELDVDDRPGQFIKVIDLKSIE
jgi:hypothetical protein